MIWVVFAWVVAVALVVVLALTAGLGVWRSVKVLTTAIGELGAHAAAAADELSSLTTSVGTGDAADTTAARPEPARGAGRTMKARRRPPVGRGR